MLGKVVIRDPDKSGWLVFSDPVDVLVAHEPADVIAVMMEAERRVNLDSIFAAGFVSYEAAPGFDSAFETHAGHDLPLVCFGLFAKVQQVDALTKPNGESRDAPVWKMTTSRKVYIDNIARIKQQIAAGNTYQINYTVRERATIVSEPLDLFLEMAADAPYASYIECSDHAIVSASPELFFRLNDDHLVSKPMKGTAPRGLRLDDDLALRQWLHNSSKNRAENVMITDMVRNDIGRIAKPGTVAVSNFLAIEKYPTVWQLTSTASAKTNASVSEIFGALFPSSSITGAPKVSSMAIISTLEDEPREVYTGAIGYIGPDRNAQFNVAIRTILIDKKSKDAVYGVGGGIVWDSDPEEEYEECLTKAKILSSPRFSDFDLIETILWTPKDGYFLLDGHLDRLCASAQYFDFEFNRGLIQQTLVDYAKQLPRRQHRIRLLMSREGNAKITDTPISADGRNLPYRIVLARDPVDITNPFIYHKTTRRGVYDRALEGAGDSDDVLLWNEDGYITETSIANVIVCIDGERYTPSLECGLLAGTYRELMLQRGEISERNIHMSELTPASDLTLINSVRKEFLANLALKKDRSA